MIIRGVPRNFPSRICTFTFMTNVNADCTRIHACTDSHTLSLSHSHTHIQVKWRNLHFVMWDIGGQESLRQAWSTYYTGSHFLILVVDSTDRERLSVSKEELYKMLGHEVCVCVCASTFLHFVAA